MYADRHAQPTRFNPGGLTAAVAINAALVAALMFAGPTILPGPTDHGPTIVTVPIDPPPPPEPPKPQPKPHEATASRPDERIVAPIPPMPMPAPTGFTTTVIDSPPAGPLVGNDPGPVAVDPPAPPLPPLIGPQVDPRYAASFQPTYPPAERRANHDGRVTMRVLVGIDGRVREIERVTATSDAFWQVTQERALRSWRFKPATRGSVPVEAWRTMTLTFRMEDAG